MDEVQELRALSFDEDTYDYLQREWICGINGTSCAEENDREFRRLLIWLATPPKFTTLRINTRLQEPDMIVSEIHRAITEQYEERGNVPPKCFCHPLIYDLAVVPNKGPRELKKEEKEVMVGLGCGIAVLRGADVYAQGIMAAPPNLKFNDRVSVYADVDGGVRKGLVKNFTGKRMHVGNGFAVMDRRQIFCSGDKPSGLAIRMTEPLYLAPSLSGLMPTLLFPQNLPSVVCSHVLDPEPGETVLDMCAAPGGKTTHIACLMKNKGRVVALDKSKGKIKIIEKNACAWDLSCIEAYHFDGTKALDPEAALEGSPPFPPLAFDRIMLDAPCSALGQRPAIRNNMKLVEVTSYSPLQRKLFSSAWNLLRPGGTLVYSTCTWTMEENEKLVSWALKTFDDINLLPQCPPSSTMEHFQDINIYPKRCM